MVIIPEHYNRKVRQRFVCARNIRVVARVTDQNVANAPRMFWQQTVKDKTASIRSRRVFPNWQTRLDDITIAESSSPDQRVSVTRLLAGVAGISVNGHIRGWRPVHLGQLALIPLGILGPLGWNLSWAKCRRAGWKNSINMAVKYGTNPCSQTLCFRRFI